MTAWVDNCVVCGNGLGQSGNRRVRIPWLGGKRKLVHAECAVQVHRQATLDDEIEPEVLARARTQVDRAVANAARARTAPPAFTPPVDAADLAEDAGHPLTRREDAA